MVTGRDARGVHQRVLLLVVATSIAGSLPVFLVAALSVQLDADLGLSASALGILIAAYYTACAAGAPLLGLAVERLGWSRSLRVALGLTAVSLLWVAGAGSVPLVGLALVGGGIGAALGQPAVNVAIRDGTAPSRQPVAFGVKQAAVPGAILLAGASVPVLSTTLGWRGVYALMAGVTAALLLVVPASGRAPGPAVEPPVARTGLRVRPAFLIAGMLGAGVGNSASGFLVFSLVDAGWSEASAALVLVYGAVLGIAARVAVPWGTRDSLRRAYGSIAAMLALGGVGSILLSAGAGTASTLAGAALTFGGGWGWAGLYMYLVVRENPTKPAGATGIVLSATYAGAALGPYLTGAVADRWGMPRAWWMIALWGVTGAVLMSGVLWRRFPRS